jgi:nitroimidazol reductase NimA-like FMN-containing flavoprotein (pyridoxamine 5'-phosphate oxidase superfamily)
MTTEPLVIRHLERNEMEAILARNHVGRLAYTFKDKVDIEPIHYVFEGGVLYGRTSPGTKLLTVVRHPWVAFEVDEVEALFKWRSVVAHGTFYPIDPRGSDAEVRAYRHAVEVLRGILPDTLLEGDPTPERRILFRVHVDQMTGREAGGAAT